MPELPAWGLDRLFIELNKKADEGTHSFVVLHLQGATVQGRMLHADTTSVVLGDELGGAIYVDRGRVQAVTLRDTSVFTKQTKVREAPTKMVPTATKAPAAPATKIFGPPPANRAELGRKFDQMATALSGEAGTRIEFEIDWSGISDGEAATKQLLDLVTDGSFALMMIVQNPEGRKSVEEGIKAVRFGEASKLAVTLGKGKLNLRAPLAPASRPSRVELQKAIEAAI